MYTYWFFQSSPISTICQYNHYLVGDENRLNLGATRSRTLVTHSSFIKYYSDKYNLCSGVFASCHSVDPINDILGEISRNREVLDRQGLTSVELTNNKQKLEDPISSNQIVIRVTDTDGDTKGKIIFIHLP